MEAKMTDGIEAVDCHDGMMKQRMSGAQRGPPQGTEVRPDKAGSATGSRAAPVSDRASTVSG